MKGKIRITAIGGETGEFIRKFLDKLDTIEKQNSALIEENSELKNRLESLNSLNILEKIDDLQCLLEDVRRRVYVEKKGIWDKFKNLIGKIRTKEV